MPLKALKNEETVDPRFNSLCQTLRSLEGNDDLLLCEEDGNGEARISILEGQFFVDAPNNQRGDLTFLTKKPSVAIHAAKEIIEAYYG